ncbi:hypothetical protein BDY21DRAFT_340437 [Lineolata rhizophorae]|uniref:Uncharacterized protein n=1 Tax=Lineolata rhizophorae TaxID=578093 RepID=A0A6A6P3F6_9PEZI|nr:hypothetical protein BDY21DRAFT_340437 [Lineolata rhizophorae]
MAAISLLPRTPTLLPPLPSILPARPRTSLALTRPARHARLPFRRPRRRRIARRTGRTDGGAAAATRSGKGSRGAARGRGRRSGRGRGRGRRSQSRGRRCGLGGLGPRSGGVFTQGRGRRVCECCRRRGGRRRLEPVGGDARRVSAQLARRLLLRSVRAVLRAGCVGSGRARGRVRRVGRAGGAAARDARACGAGGVCDGVGAG